MSARLVVVMRQSPDWEALASGAPHDTEAFDRMIGRPVGTTAGLIALWNESFAIDFYAVRVRIKAIMMQSLGQLGAETVPLARFAPPFDAGAIYVFTDDDDWFSPELAARLDAADDGRWDALVWTSLRFDGTVTERANDGFCYTNNYAVHGRFLARQPQDAAIVAQHFTAQGHFSAPDSARALLHEPLSITHKHPASTVTLERAKAEGRPLRDLVERYRDYEAGRLEGQRPPPAWAHPQMDAAAAFFTSL